MGITEMPRLSPVIGNIGTFPAFSGTLWAISGTTYALVGTTSAAFVFCAAVVSGFAPVAFFFAFGVIVPFEPKTSVRGVFWLSSIVFVIVAYVCAIVA